LIMSITNNFFIWVQTSFQSIIFKTYLICYGSWKEPNEIYQ
jgi:hypothetical protein